MPIDFAWAGAIDTCSRFQRAFWGSAIPGAWPTWSDSPGSAWEPPVRRGRGVGQTLPRTHRTHRLKMVRSKPLPFPPEPARQLVIDMTRRSWPRPTSSRAGATWLKTLDRLGLGFRQLARPVITGLHREIAMATSITHWIDGRTWDGPAQRHGTSTTRHRADHQDRRLRVRRRRQRGGRVGARRV